MKLKDLKYITLEGGGGKGAVYSGAILALEKLLYKEWLAKQSLRIKNGELAAPTTPEIDSPPADLKGAASVGSKPLMNYPAIMDYYDLDKTTKIEGISGASTGAITAFPLALGLNSAEINKIVLTYPFNEKFTPNHQLHEGKYRMVGMGSDGTAKILIAEDSGKKLGDKNIEPYRFSGNKPFKIGMNLGKSLVRSAIVTEAIRIILIGFKDRLNWIEKLVDKLQRYITDPDHAINSPEKNVRQILASLNSGVIDFFSNSLVMLTKRQVISVLKRLPINPIQLKKLEPFPVNHIIPAVSNVIWDRGIYGGFEIRDFFYRILLKALSTDTHFRRGILKHKDILKKLEISVEDIKNLKLNFDDEYNVTVPTTVKDNDSKPKNVKEDNSQRTLEALAQLPELLTFSVFHEITGLNLCICVTNMTTNQPVYFSHYFTPDFPVIEAVGSSMGFPFAFKPNYNEANVFLNPDGNITPDFVVFTPSEGNSNIYKETFGVTEYNRHLAEVLNLVKKYHKLNISTNGNLSFRSYLPYLRRMLNDNRLTQDEKSLCHFFYNAAFKGLFIDGGVTNNLPISVFTFTTNKTGVLQEMEVKNNVLALKLDNSFPPEMREIARQVLEEDEKLLQKLTNIEDKAIHLAFAARLFKKIKLRKFYTQNIKDSSLDFAEMSKEVWVKVAKELAAEYKQNHSGFTPWNKQTNIISGLFSSLQFGLDQGQIENIADNENIINLYCYGIGVLDFDLASEKMSQLVKKATYESERSVLQYFQ